MWDSIIDKSIQWRWRAKMDKEQMDKEQIVKEAKETRHKFKPKGRLLRPVKEEAKKE